MNILIELDEVLAHGERFPTCTPIPEGRDLYHALKASHTLMLVTGEEDEALVKHWLKVEGLYEHAYLILGKHTFRAQYDEAVRQGVVPDLYLTANPDNVVHAAKVGVPAMLYTHPQFMRPGFRPDDHRGARSWDEIKQEILNQKERKAEVDRAALAETLHWRHTD